MSLATDLALERRQEKARRYERILRSKMTCTWPGCESIAHDQSAHHEGMHQDDLTEDRFCAFHEDEVWFISNVQDDLARELGIGWYE